MTETVLEYRGVSKIYKTGESEVFALKNINAVFYAGELTALVGPSGSGKTTMQHLGAGFDKPSRGTVLLMGNPINSYTEKELALLRNQHIGFIFQSFNLIPVMSVLENVMYPAEVYGPPRRFEGAVKDRAFSLLEKTGLESHAKKRPHQLSGGQRQRVAIARALMNNPELVFADEPTANLDHATGAGILELLIRLNREMGTAVVFSTHDPAVMALARRILTLRDGTLRENEP
ncbi:MAG: ABC transporter ATP-binding protein [Treponema sp.]|jgi:putative ABC transport system ATP-binding protein|nr:ABC transporter ATP-binding protein [Treponema sp.]